MRVKKYLALIFAAILATTMLTGCPWDIEDDAASDSSSAPSSSSRPSHDSSDDDSGSGSAPSSPSTPDDEESENPDPIETLKQYGTVEGDTLTITNTEGLGFSNESFRNALNNAPTIKKIVFDARVTFIPNSAFYKCTNLTNVELDNVTSIGASAFSDCTGLTSVDLDSVTSIGSHAFDSCTSLAHICLGDGMKEYNNDTLFTDPTGVHPDAFKNIADTVHVYYGEDKNEAETKWEELDLTMASGTQVEYLPASEWENRENSDNAADALPGAMKGLLALAERLG